MGTRGSPTHTTIDGECIEKAFQCAKLLLCVRQKTQFQGGLLKIRGLEGWLTLAPFSFLLFIFLSLTDEDCPSLFQLALNKGRKHFGFSFNSSGGLVTCSVVCLPFLRSGESSYHGAAPRPPCQQCQCSRKGVTRFPTLQASANLLSLASSHLCPTKSIQAKIQASSGNPKKEL